MGDTTKVVLALGALYLLTRPTPAPVASDFWRDAPLPQGHPQAKPNAQANGVDLGKVIDDGTKLAEALRKLYESFS